MHNHQIVSDPAAEFKAKDACPMRGKNDSDLDYAKKLVWWAQFRVRNHHLLVVDPSVVTDLETQLVEASVMGRVGDIVGCSAICNKVAEEALQIRLQVGAEYRQRVESCVPYLGRLPERSQIGLLKSLRFFGLPLPRVNPKVDRLAQEGYVVFRYLLSAVPDIERQVALLVPEPTLEVPPAEPEETEEVDDREPELFMSSEELEEELYADVPIRGRAQRVQITRMRENAAKVAAKNMRAARNLKRLAHAG